jgi:hypothetical protein
MSAKELRDKLKALRMEHTGGALSKMSLEQVQNEIAHHETACKARETKEKRLAALEAAREAKKAPPAAAAVKVPRAPKQVPARDTPAAKKNNNIIQGFPKKKATVTMAEVEVPKKRGRPAKAGVQTIADRAEEKNGQRQE